MDALWTSDGGGSQWGTASPTSTSTPSTRCSTAPPGSPTSWRGRGRRPAGDRHHRPRQHVRRPATSTRRAATQGIKPVIGSELYMAHESRSERPSRRGRIDDTGGDGEGGAKLYYHLTALAETDEGYRNLIQLSSEAFLEGYYYKPRVDWELLAEHSEGLIATTGCLGGHVLQHLLARRLRRGPEDGRAAAGHLRARQPLRRAAGPRHPRAAPHQPAAARDRQAAAGAAARHQRQPLRRAQRRRSPTTRCCACRPAR